MIDQYGCGRVTFRRAEWLRKCASKKVRAHCERFTKLVDQQLAGATIVTYPFQPKERFRRSAEPWRWNTWQTGIRVNTISPRRR